MVSNCVYSVQSLLLYAVEFRGSFENNLSGVVVRTGTLYPPRLQLQDFTEYVVVVVFGLFNCNWLVDCFAA